LGGISVVVVVDVVGVSGISTAYLKI